MKTRTIHRRLLALFTMCLGSSLSPAFATDDELPRRSSIGLAVQEAEAGAVVTALRPDGPADQAGVRVGDQLVSLGGRALSTNDDLGEILKIVGSQTVDAIILRDGVRSTLPIELETLPAESIQSGAVEYSSVTTPRGYRLRTIITTPANSPLARDGRSPAFMFVQGIYCASLDRPQAPEAVDTRLVHAMADAGYVTLRVDKPGLGDSEGPRCSDIDFREELEGYIAALQHLASRPDVDPDRIYVFGHSMGGVMAPYLAQEVPVAGSIVFGTLVRTWFEYQLENTRRQMELAGYPPSVVTQAVLAETLTSSMILVEKKTLGDVWERYPELRNPGPMASENHLASRHMSFYHQLQDLNLADAWSNASGAVLAIHGEFDWVTAWEDHEQIAEVINSARPGQGKAMMLPQTDHAFTVHDSIGLSFGAMGRGEWNGALPEAVIRWIAELEEAGAAPGPEIQEQQVPEQARADEALPAWTILNTESYRGKQDDVFFVSSSTGWYANGAGKIFRTTDGGDTWTLQAHMPGTYFRCLAFVDENIGFAGNIGPGYFPGVSDDTVLYRTDDGGASWHAVEGIDNPELVGLCAIEIVREPFVHAGVLDEAIRILAVGRVGGPAAMVFSDDLGKTWRNVPLSDHTAMAFDVHFFDRHHGVVAGASSADVTKANARILTTSDGGRTWQIAYQSDRPYELSWKISFPSRDVGYVTVQSYNPDPSISQRVVAKTTDGGRTWKELPFANDPTVRAFGVGFVDGSRGWIGAVPHGFQTVDGGATWQPADFGNAVNKIRLLREGDNLHAFAIGVNVAKTSLPAPAETR